MKKLLGLIVMSMLCISMFAQPGYSINDKKAIKMYEEAQQAYNLYYYVEAESLLNDALSRNDQFIEAHLLLAQVYADKNRNAEAITSLENAVAIDPGYFPLAYYFLGEMYLIEGQYAESRASFTRFLDGPVRDVTQRDRATLGIASCDFAVEAMNNPVPFDPINLGPGVNTADPEYYPCLTADDATLLFTREVSHPMAMRGRQEDFFVSHSSGDQWEQATNIAEINTLMNEGAPTLSQDGQVLIFTACEIEGQWGDGRNGLGSCDLFFSYKIGNMWSKASNLGERVNSYSWDSQPSLAADGRTLYFVRGKSSPSGIKEQDIWVSHLGEDQVWEKPKRLPGAVNTPFEEESVLIHPDGQTLYFSSNGHPGMGGLDIFMSRLQPDGTWGTPVNLGYPINTNGNENSLLVSASGELAYFASDREGGYGSLDLYYFTMPEQFRPVPVTYAKGVVFDATSFKKLEARVQVIDLETGKVVAESYSNPKSGEFLVCLPADHDYALNASREGYLFYSANFSLTANEDATPYTLEAPLEKVRPGNKVVMNNIFFDTDKYDLKPQSMVELNKLVEFLILNRHTRVEIGGHTDDIGSEADNQLLSERRAQAVVDYVVSKGIEPFRLVAKGYGESQPVVPNSDDASRAKNRRTEFMVVE
ncbi:MAG: PD40 domain-containing protein [Flavobacteriales bacterium]|nr:PD40 domain-containing protein [Flavobacteriales bacterium]